MLIDIWLLQHAAALAEQAVSHMAAAATTIQHETHLLLEDITNLGHPGGDLTVNGPPIDGGCASN